jgi:hypothetical protein
MKRSVLIAILGIAGLVGATAMTLGALALAGNDIGEVVHPRLVDASQTASHVPTPSSSPGAQSPSVDDHGGASPSVDDHGGGGSGSGSSSGSGSGSGDGSGSGSNHSGDDD